MQEDGEALAPLDMEVKVWVIEALEVGLNAEEVGELAVMAPGTIEKWRNQCPEGGV